MTNRKRIEGVRGWAVSTLPTSSAHDKALQSLAGAQADWAPHSLFCLSKLPWVLAAQVNVQRMLGSTCLGTNQVTGHPRGAPNVL